MFKYEKIRKRRMYLGLTQKELAKQMDVSNSIIPRWEAGKKLPNARNLGKLCAVLKVTPNYFFK